MLTLTCSHSSLLHLATAVYSRHTPAVEDEPNTALVSAAKEDIVAAIFICETPLPPIGCSRQSAFSGGREPLV